MQRTLFRALENHFQNYNLFLLSPSSTSKTPISFTRRNHTHDTGVEFSGVRETIRWETNPDGFTLVQMIRNCINHRYVSHGKQLHCYALQSGFASNVYVNTALVSFYAKVVSLDDAHKLFDEMSQPNVVSWNSIISGYVHSGNLYKALSLFLELNQSDLLPDAYSFTSALAACGQLSLLLLGMSIHSRIILYGLESSVVVANCLIDMYGKCSSDDGAIHVFNELKYKDVISWNTVIAACARNRRLELASDYFYQMPYPDTVTYNEMINGISQFGDIDEAIKILKSMPNPNSSSWNAIISGYVVKNRAWEALNFFTQMKARSVVMDEFTYSSILSGIACISALRWGTLLHCCVIKQGLVTSMMIGSALVDMYSKCGQVKDAEMLFQFMPRKNIVTWNALISGLANNGESHKVVQYFEELKDAKGLKPDDITFVNVLAACSQCQMPLERAYEYLISMNDDYGIKPKPNHLASIIRLMGHHGQLCKAESMIYELGFGSCPSVWRALLGACGACGDLDVAKVAAAKLRRLEDNEVGYVILSNINKDRGNWVDATAVWDLMRDEGVVKEAGFSRI
ncbi:putative pentatricopeptide repeat-containing protein At5g47460 [Spinacia oleracea]|uniref:Pentatricopeptide repeat-containing protein At5g47460 n=1 Tax=Spinacia oleracea TaxID=3562 RepID=A0A9R0IY93_SPIOL|nr:putative pentatricopeptide repeat-containing protein At5g47460 [Spinacia oleracea]